jgi:hypothetical protein
MLNAVPLAFNPAEVVCLVQRRSLVMLPLWLVMAFGGAVMALGWTRPGNLAVPLVVVLVSVAPFVVLRGWYRRRFGDVRASEAQRRDALVAGVGIFAAFVLFVNLGPRTVPSIMPFVFATAIGGALVRAPWRVSLHWWPVVGVLLWISVSHVMGPAWLMIHGAEGALVGMSGAVASVIDHLMLVRAFRHGSVTGGQVARVRA